MRRLLTAWLTATLLVALLAAPVGAKGPKCADIRSANAAGTLSSAAFDGEADTVAGRFFLAAAGCPKVTYTLFLLDDEGDTTPIAQASVTGDGATAEVQIFVTGVTASDGDVCAYVESSRGGKVIDRAPADGCVILLDDGTSPGGGKGF